MPKSISNSFTYNILLLFLIDLFHISRIKAQKINQVIFVIRQVNRCHESFGTRTAEQLKVYWNIYPTNRSVTYYTSRSWVEPTTTFGIRALRPIVGSCRHSSRPSRSWCAVSIDFCICSWYRYLTFFYNDSLRQSSYPTRQNRNRSRDK